MSDYQVDKIQSRGHWRVVVRPSTFVKDRVKNILDLKPLLESCAVKLRGWDFPHIDYRTEIEIGDDWVAQPVDWEMYIEYWRFYQSPLTLQLSLKSTI